MSPAPHIRSVVDDQSTRIPSQLGVYAGIVVPSKKGPLVPTLCTSQSQFLKWFTPNEKLEVGFDIAHQSALDYLSYSNRLWVVRAIKDALYGGCVVVGTTSGNTSTPLNTGTDSPTEYSFTTGDAFLIYGANPGLWNNDISIKIITDATVVKIANAFIINVYKGTTLVESHLCSRKQDAKDGYGNNIYIEDALEASNYIRAFDNVALDDDILPKAYTSAYLALNGGSDGSAVTDSENIAALNLLSNVNAYTVQLILNGGNTSAVFQKAIEALCQTRREETFGILTTPYTDEVSANYINDILDYRNIDLNLNTYTSALFTPHIKIYDRFTDKNIYVSPDGHIGGLMSQTIQNFGYHYPTAGYKRGIINNALDLSVRYTQDDNAGGEVDVLYDAGINPLIFNPGRGIVIYGNKTLWSTPSDLESISVSMLINLQIRPGLREFLKDYLFELNDDATRSILVAKIETYMDTLKAKRAVYDYYVLCNDENNSPQDVQDKRLNVWLYIKPTLPIEFIEQKLIITPNGLDFSSLKV